MTAILKVDTIQDVDGNNIINENSNTITIGASGDTINVPSGATFNINGTAGTGVGISGWSSSSGSLLPASASAGIYLGVNSATAANLLDDYEVGTWTPSVASTSGSFTTVGTVAGYYTKIGNMVHFQADIRITTNGTASANINVNGLPFTSANPGLDHTVNMARETQINGATFTTIISANVTQLVMLSPPFGNGAGYCINGVYRV